MFLQHVKQQISLRILKIQLEIVFVFFPLSNLLILKGDFLRVCALLVKILLLWYSSLQPHSSVRYRLRGVSPLSLSLPSLTYWCTVLYLTSLCVEVPGVCLGRLKQKRYWKELYCRSALKMMPHVKISDAKTHEKVGGKRLQWSPRRKTQGLLLPCVRPGPLSLQWLQCGV